MARICFKQETIISPLLFMLTHEIILCMYILKSFINSHGLWHMQGFIRYQDWKWVTLLTYLTHWPTKQSGCDPHMTHLWPTCWSFLFKSNVTWPEKFLIWNNAIDFFILGRIQNHSLAQTPWRWNLWTPHASKQLEIISWFHTNDNSVHSSDPKFTHLSDANTVF